MNDLTEIILYRQEMKGKCVSTTHKMSINTFANICENLLERYHKFNDVEMIAGVVTLTIPMY